MTEMFRPRLQPVTPLDTDPANMEVDAGVNQMDGRFEYMTRCTLCGWYSQKILAETAASARETVVALFRRHQCAQTMTRWRLDY